MREIDVIIIGAGMSGASAAHDLAKAGKSVVILEAADRIGGRLWSDEHDGVTVDLGGGWIQFSEWNPLKGLADHYGIEHKPWFYEDAAFFGKDGKQVPDLDERVAAFGTALAEVVLYASKRKAAGEKDESLRDGFDLVLQDASPDEKEAANDFLEILEVPLGAPAKDLSLYYWGDDLHIGLENEVLPGGYVQLVKALAKGIPVERNAVVQCIAQDDDGVTVTTKDGRTFAAKQAIVTVSVGVLKKGCIDFQPELPSWKTDAMKGIAMGVVDKYWFRFDERFWTAQVKQKTLFRLGDDGSVWNDLMDFSDIAGVPLMLALVGGADGQAVEKQSDDEVMDGLLKSLRVLFGEAAKRPIGVRRSHWGQYEWTQGSYSHLLPGGTINDRINLGKPFGRVHFAGEATSQYCPFSVHGAWLTGRREAARILTPDSVPDELTDIAVTDAGWWFPPLRIRKRPSSALRAPSPR